VDFAGLFLLALIWAFFKLVSKSREGSAPPTRPQSRPGLGPLHDPPQEEGRALRMLLKELERAAQRQSGPAARPAARRLPSAEAVEEGTSLEVTPQVESLEVAPLRRDRVTVDQDEEAEQVIARRSAATAARAGGRTEADRRQLDQRIRQEPADRTALRGLTPQQLRDAVVWREILGPPVAERDR
jgi:hypothetical protein